MNFTNCPTNILYLDWDLIQIRNIAFHCHIPHFQTVPRSLLLYHYTLKSTGRLFCRVFLNWGLPCVFSWLNSGYAFWAPIPQKWYGVLTSAKYKELTMITWLRWLRWFLHHKVTLFPLKLMNILWGDTMRQYKYSV